MVKYVHMLYNIVTINIYNFQKMFYYTYAVVRPGLETIIFWRHSKIFQLLANF
jgi:hypothetical protein